MNKQKLQEQIDTMREELAKMEVKLAECDKVELKGGRYVLVANGVEEFNTPHSIYRDFGATRSTKELAEIASKNMVVRNKLEAYAHQIDPKWRDGGLGTEAWSIYVCDGIYKISSNNGIRELGKVYMSESTAEQICEWLNDGRIEL